MDPVTCDDAMTSKLASLQQMGYPEDRIYEVVQLMAEASWTSMGVEQQHGSCALMRRLHPEYGLETLAQRAFLHSCRHLFTKPGRHATSSLQPVSAASASAASEVRATDAAASRVSGYNIFVSDLFAEHQQQHTAGDSGGGIPANQRQALFAQAHGLYLQVTPAERASYDQRAQTRHRD